MTIKTHCSDRHERARLVVLEGMPGAGKTVIATALEREGRTVLGEYVTPLGDTLPHGQHPPVDDDDAHQRNWTIKAARARASLAAGNPVACDRDWLSALAYAYSLAPSDGGHLLRQRLAWAERGLGEGRLLLGDIYAVLNVDADTSLHRRTGRLRAGHPWTTMQAVTHLVTFYADPPAALRPLAPQVAEHLRTATWRYLSGRHDLDGNTRVIRDLLDDR